jgi:hypothetical protein
MRRVETARRGFKATGLQMQRLIDCSSEQIPNVSCAVVSGYGSVSELLHQGLAKYEMRRKKGQLASVVNTKLVCIAMLFCRHRPRPPLAIKIVLCDAFFFLSNPAHNPICGYS